MVGDISIYGQESNYTTWQLAKMTVSLRAKRGGEAGPAGVEPRDGFRSLAICGIDAHIAHGDTFHSDRFPDLKADTILANPPLTVLPGAKRVARSAPAGRSAGKHFDSVRDWWGELLLEDKCWKYGVPPAGTVFPEAKRNAIAARLRESPRDGANSATSPGRSTSSATSHRTRRFLFANGSMFSNKSGEGDSFLSLNATSDKRDQQSPRGEAPFSDVERRAWLGAEG